MERLELVRKEVDAILLEQIDDEVRRNGYVHLYGVAQLCSMLALKRKLDVELCTIIGLLHDIFSYKFGYSKDHGMLGANEAEKMLKDLNVFTVKEIEIVKNAIRHHSEKKNKHDKYCELIKDADAMQNRLYQPYTETKHEKRVKKAFKSFGLKLKFSNKKPESIPDFIS